MTNAIDLAYELSEFNHKNITEDQIREIIDKLSQLPKHLIFVNNVDDIIKEWKSFTKIVIKYEFQRRIPSIYIGFCGTRKDGKEDESDSTQFSDILRDRVNRLIVCYDETACNNYIQDLFHPDVLEMFKRHGVDFKIQCDGEGSDS
jgi:hypothetical protein